MGKSRGRRNNLKGKKKRNEMQIEKQIEKQIEFTRKKTKFAFQMFTVS